MSRKRFPFALLLVLLSICLLFAMGASVFWGRELAVRDVLAYLFDKPGFPGGAAGGLSLVVENTLSLALPRILLAAIVGAGLAWSGAVFQSLFANPLADPYFLGVSAGASFGYTLVMVLGAAAGAADTIFGLGLANLAAFGCALAAVLCVYLIARRRGRLPLAHLVLAGLAVSAVLTALVSALMFIGSERLDRIVLATMGSFMRASWEKAALAWPAILIAMLASSFFARDLNLILLGEERAFGLGVEVEKRKRVLLALATFIAAAAVASSGIIWFAGLIVPHLVRLVTGPDNRRLLPASALSGALLLVTADSLARTLVPGTEVPIGILTALLGAPFFIYLIQRNKRTAAEGR